MKGPQLGCFFVLVLFHALEDVGQDGDGFDDVRAFIEHDTFSPFAHGGVRDFRPCRQDSLDQVFQDLRGPDDGDVR